MDQQTVMLFAELADLRIARDTQIVEGDDLTGPPGGSKEVAGKDAEGDFVQGSDEGHSRWDPGWAEGGDQRGWRAKIAGNAANRPFALGSAGGEPGQGERRARLSDRDQIGRVKGERPVELAGGVPVLVPLGGQPPPWSCPNRPRARYGGEDLASKLSSTKDTPSRINSLTALSGAFAK